MTLNYSAFIFQDPGQVPKTLLDITGRGDNSNFETRVFAENHELFSCSRQLFVLEKLIG